MKSKVLTGLVLMMWFWTPAISMAENLIAVLHYRVAFAEHGSTPTDVVVAADGSIGVYDAFSGSYLMYDANGHASGEIHKDFLKGGNCLVKDRDGFIFCNNADASLDMLSNALERRVSFRLPPDLKGRYDPTDALVAEDYVYSVDNDNHRILKSKLTSGGFISLAGNYGQSRLSFWYPYAIAADVKGVLYISEVMNTRVQKITTDLKFYQFIGKWGITSGEFYRPTGIAIYNGTTLLVADGYTGVIQRLDMDGKSLGLLVDGTGTKVALGSPTHIRVTENILAVVDAFHKAVHVYQLKKQ